MAVNVSGTEGYAENAQALIEHWQGISCAEHHKPILHLLPTDPSDVLDIGAGIGTDAAAFATMGHRVVAVEPVDQFRAAAIKLHSSPRIEWVDDCLPDLAVLNSRKQTFDLVMLTAVWMHLDEEQRRRAMAMVGSVLRDGALMIMSLRHGPPPSGRRMFDVSPEETIALANGNGLRVTLNVRTESAQAGNRRMRVTWSRLAFVKDRGLHAPAG
ncbi:class I SAM-dependent methyltransferase [Trinickia dinghuensis]|uniref:Class I SAM-dependent methyltransferase n=1 Tax=Trinickia dinghuensis TaxID=2291023 RepID=A0A3D8K440_9BURK|nr:class I SAM-dependent methyltransferase [Trinickia dinghuensis]RDV00238.1 class I SAM-dependent methyltransferase [Trinickia dinghuensis]